MIVLISVIMLPLAIWDSQSGRYRSYLNWRAAGVLLFTAVFFGFRAYSAGDDGWQIFGDICFYLSQAVIGSRIFVEYCHHYMHKVWLHRQYHKLTGQQVTRTQTSSGAEGAAGSRQSQAGKSGEAGK